MQTIGFSTGALCKGDFKTAIEVLIANQVSAVELSALRMDELSTLVNALPLLRLSRFSHVSMHVPSRFEPAEEREVLFQISKSIEYCSSFVIHPDVIFDPSQWEFLGKQLLIENMDKRKALGRSVNELLPLFDALPDAGFCFDIGHARQVDPSMNTAYGLLTTFRNILRQVHISHVNSASKHDRLTFDAILSFRELASQIPVNAPIIIESTITLDQIQSEIERTREAIDLSLEFA